MTVADTAESLRTALASRYAVERELGRGGMATVYLARDLRHDRLVALKVLHAELGATLGPERFQREVRLTARLSHPNILPVLDSGETAGRLWYAMPYVAGETLRRRLVREAQLGVADAVRIAAQVAAALGHAHGQGIVHRDVKPENILLEGDRALVADFGIAKLLDGGGERLTETGLSLGTPAYMSPEQATSGRVEARSDVYALGCVVYEMLAGAPPFTGPTAQAILARHAVDPVPPLRTVRMQVPAGVEEAVERALAKVPADRFASAEDFAAALTVPPAGPHRWRRRSIGGRVVVLVVGGLTVLGGVVGWRALRLVGKPSVVASATRIAVIPLAAPQGDTALARLGRDLATTVSASLDGVGGIETADRLATYRETLTRSASSPAGAAAVADRLGAGSALHGTVVGDGSNVRLDLGLYESRTVAPIAQGITVTAHRDSLGALTDSVTWAVLRQVWQRGRPPTPSLAAVTTRSLPALRSFLEGERHLQQGWWTSAALAYRSAISSDSAFRLAYFRYADARSWVEQEVEPEILEALRRFQDALPERERLLLASRLEPSESKTRDLLLELTRRFPDYWPGWFRLGDHLYHVGPILGHTWKDAQAALRRAVALNPDLQPAWEHLLINSLGRDTAERNLASTHLQEFRAPDPAGNREQAAADYQRNRLWVALERTRGTIGPSDSALADSVARFSVSPAATGPHRDAAPVTFLWVGNPAAQISFNRRVMALADDPSVVPSFLFGSAWAWAERGAWDSALAAMDEAVRREPGSMGIRRYSMAVLGSWLGAVSPSEVATRRPAALRSIAVEGDQGGRARLTGSLAWLDGVAAAAREDREELATAIRAARTSGHAAASLLARSLGAFDRALDGDRAGAARELARIERECAESAWSECGGEPVAPNIAAHRLAAAAWLLEAGDTAEAARLLTWHEARFAAWTWSFAVAPLAYLMQGRVAEAWGNTSSAGQYYRQFLRRYDRPLPRQAHLVEEARAALARLTVGREQEGQR